MGRIRLGPVRYTLSRKYANMMRKDAEIFVPKGHAVEEIDLWDVVSKLAADTYAFISLYLDELNERGKMNKAKHKGKSQNFGASFNKYNTDSGDISYQKGDDGVTREDTNIITNENENTVLNKLELLKKYGAKYVDFATGFLFLEGWKHIEKTIPDNIDRFRLLFGFTDPGMAALLSKILSDKDVEYVLSKLSRSLSDSALEDIENNEGFKKLNDEEKLYVKWIDMLHAKLYLYYKKEINRIEDSALFDGRAIVGSSNLTTRGLTQEGEINVWVDKPNEVISLVEWFERMWEKGEELDPDVLLHAIVNEKSRRHAIKTGEFIDVEDLEWSLKDAYLFLFWYLLGGVYSIEDVKEMVKGGRERPLIKKHNEEAVIWAYQIIDKYGGVILADPVGIGKSYQALGVISFLRMKKDVEKILLIAPPHLIKGSDDEPGHWERYIRDFFGNVTYVGEVEGITQSRILRCEDSKGEFEIALVSSYGLSLLSSDSDTVGKLSEYDVVVVDEAHHFKNINAKKRVILDEVVRGHRDSKGENPYTVLLTATPIINDVAEILALMSIYLQGDTGDFDVLARTELDRDIIKAFENYQEATRKLKDTELEHSKRKEWEKKKRESLEEISKFLKEAIVLRSRAYIEKKYWGGRGYRPILRNMGYEYTEKELKMIDLINDLSLKYLDISPSTLLFIRKISVKADHRKLHVQGEPITLEGIMKILLAKRLESSSYSFMQTLAKMRNTMEFIMNKLKSGDDAERIARDIFLRKINKLPEEDETLSEEGIEYEEKYDILKGEAFNSLAKHIDEILRDKEKLNGIIEGIKEDIKKIDEFLRGDIENIAKKMDSKERKLLEYINSMKKQKKKVIIYSMYVDTVEWLERYLKEHGYSDDEVFVVTGKTKFKSAEIEKFREKYGFGMMLSTDALSEGVNLEFVDELVNYDIPWTPSTIMQRVGRLWRENRTKEIIFYSILPPGELQIAFSSVIEKVEEKLEKIKDVLIQEIKLLKESETLTDDFEDKVYGNVYTDDESLRDFLRSLGEKEMEGLKNMILELINSEEIDGRSLKEILRVRSEEFTKIEEEINRGRILNMSYRDKPIAIINFGKRWWMKISGNFKMYTDPEIAEVIKEGWEEAKKGNRRITWGVRGTSLSKEHIVTSFKNQLKRHITNVVRNRRNYEWKILNQLLQARLGEERNEELRALKNKAFLVLAYYFYNKKRSQKRLKAIGILKELGFIDKNKNPNPSKFNDQASLKKLLEVLGADVEEPMVEVLI